MARARKQGRQKGWSYSAGERGRNRVRVFGHQTTGLLFLEYYEEGPGGSTAKRKRVALGHLDREKAKRQADEAAAALAKAEAPRTEALTLQRLFDMYEREVTPSKGRRKQDHDRRARRPFNRCWGASAQMKQLDRSYRDR